MIDYNSIEKGINVFVSPEKVGRAVKSMPDIRVKFEKSEIKERSL